MDSGFQWPVAMRVAVFDYFVVDGSPSGSCVLAMLRGLADEHDFTVFSATFDNPNPARIQWVRIPVIRRPVILLFLVYQFTASVRFLLYRAVRRTQFDCVVAAESSFLFADIAYIHSCRRVILNQHFAVAGGRGARKCARWILYSLHCALESFVFRRAWRVVVPSQGTALDFCALYPRLAHRIEVINNAVDVGVRVGSALPACAVRAQFGLAATDTVIIFVALGNFEHKGLGLLIEALEQTSVASLTLLVVGGTWDAAAQYRRQAADKGLGGRVVFAGMRERGDVLSLMRCADVFALPSCYEAFPLVALEAASCGLPLLVTSVHGVEDFVRDGENGWVVKRSISSIACALAVIAATDRSRLREMGEMARRSVRPYSFDAFSRKWREVLRPEVTPMAG